MARKAHQRASYWLREAFQQRARSRIRDGSEHRHRVEWHIAFNLTTKAIPERAHEAAVIVHREAFDQLPSEGASVNAKLGTWLNQPRHQRPVKLGLVQFQAGEHWWPDREFEQTHIKPQQEARYEGDVWEEKIAEYLNGLSSSAKVTVSQVARDALHVETSRIGTADQRRITAAMERLGWKRLPRENNQRRWARS